MIVAGDRPALSTCTWVKPTLVAEVRVTEWTSGNSLRQAAFEGLRTDKPATSVRREGPSSVEVGRGRMVRSVGYNRGVLASAALQTIVCTSRLADAERFYSDVLGLTLEGRSHGALVYRVGVATLRVSPVASVQPSEHTVMGFAVDDMRPTFESLTARGVEWVRFPGFPHDDDGVVSLPDGTRVAWFRDPDGNLLSLVQYGLKA